MSLKVNRILFVTFLALTAVFLASTNLSHIGTGLADDARFMDAPGGDVGSWRQKVTSELLDRLDNGEAPDTQVDVIIRASGDLKALHRELVRNAGGRVGKSLRIINGLSARVSLSAIEELSKQEEFSYISPDTPVRSFGHLENTTGAAQIRNIVQGVKTLDGTGVGIAVIDSGVYPTHHEIAYNGVSRLTANIDGGHFGETKDEYGHGTFVASIAAGSNHIGPGDYTGIAPGANIINIKALDASGVGSSTNIIAAVNWCVANRFAYNIKVINMSLGAPAVDSYRNDPLCLAVRAAHDAGIVVVCAAGNDGKDQNGAKIYGAIHSPGDEPSAITVGARNTYGTDARNDDTVTTYSSRGPTRGFYTNSAGVKVYDNLVKPDLVAPGNKLISSQALGCNLVAEHPELSANQGETIPYHYVMYMSGTSVSAPVVSGAAALLLQQNPSLTPNLIKAILMYTAQPLAGFNMLEQGAGQLNIAGAAQMASTLRSPVTGLSNGQSMLSGQMPQQQTTIAGQTFGWGQGVITNWTFVTGSALMTNWQGMYASGVLIADGTELSSGQLVRNPVLTTPGVSVSKGVVEANGMLLSDGVLIADGVLLSDGMLLSDGILIADGMLISDGTLIADGVLIADGTNLGFTALDGDNTACMNRLADHAPQ